MFFDDDIKADRLPPRTLCLTYDDGPGESDGDGPGPHTWELGRYLHSEGVRATFFVIGRHAEQFGETLAALAGWGHLIGNHTYTHPNLASLAGSGGDVVGEVEKTDQVIRDYLSDDLIFLRAPYGHWRQTLSPENRGERADSIVAEVLNASGRFPRHVGPVHWDVVAGDWDCWRERVSLDLCVERHLRQVEAVGRGILLLHDSSEEDAVRRRNQTTALTKRLVPELKRRGYRFVRLDEIPQVRTGAVVTAQVILSTPDGRPLRVGRNGDDSVCASPDGDDSREPFGVATLEDGRVAFRPRNGLFLSARSGRELVTADAGSIGPAETFELETLGGGEIALRSGSNAYLTIPGIGRERRLTATAVRGDRARFLYGPARGPGR